MSTTKLFLKLLGTGKRWQVPLVLALFLSVHCAIGQHVLHGLVVDENDQPLPGAAVKIKDSKDGIAANVEGKFMLEITDPNVVLQVSFIGYTTQEVVAGRERDKTFKLAPSEDANLNEVTVVGFGTQKKIAVTGAISTVSARELEKTGTPSLSNALGGKLPGIITRQSSAEPGSDQAQIFIRGLGTWGNRAPMVLVDGIERDLNTVNVQEIENFSVLKDASATAVYGVRGANGVILITTKKGALGKPKVSFRSETAMLTPIRLPKYIDGAEYAQLMNEGLVHIGRQPRWTEEEIGKFRDGSDPYKYPNVNWTDEIMRKQTYQTINNLNVSGGGEIVRYYSNVGYTDQNGIWKNDPSNAYKTNVRMRRYNLRSNVDVNVTKDLVLEVGIAGIIQKGDFPATGSDALLDAIRVTPPIAYNARNPDGSPGGTPTLIGNNPWGLATQAGYSIHMHNNVQGTFSTKWDLSTLVTKGLSLSGRFAYDHYYSGGINRHKAFEVKYYLGKDDNGEDRYTVLREEQPLSYWLWNNSNRAMYADFIINYDRTFGKHNVSGMLLYNQRDYMNITAGSSIDGLPYRRQGIAARATYSYNDKYFAEFNMGYNGSENFPKGSRFGFFPSVSAGWTISNENFMKDVGFVSNLKIRGSHGQVGNDQIGGRRFLYLTSMNARTAQGYLFGDQQTGWAGIDEMQLGTDNITWEVSTKSNLGVDLSLFNDAFTFQVDAFKERREGILLQRRTISDVAGFNPASIPYGNLGIATNQGFDGMVELKKRTHTGFYYSFMGNFTFAKSRIEAIDEPVQRFPYQSVVGHPIDQPFGLEAIGFFKDQEEIDNSPRQAFQDIVRPGDVKYRDVNDDKIIDDFDRVPIGYSRTPQIMYGMGGTISYKGVDLSVFFNGSARASLTLTGASIMPFLKGQGSFNILREFYDNRWTPETAETAKYPAVTDDINPNNYRPTTIYQRNASYVRLRNAEVGYTFPTKISQKIGMEKLRLFINGMNLLTWDKVKVMDPESNDGIGSYPIQRSLNFGIQVNFK